MGISKVSTIFGTAKLAHQRSAEKYAKSHTDAANFRTV